MSETNTARDVQRTLIGQVVSDKRDKTVTVKIDRQVRHPLYGKYMRRSSKLHVHDERNESKLGDKVAITQCRPFSKTKAWKLVQVLDKSRE
jgi:small subunit ribosomal protein S17